MYVIVRPWNTAQYTEVELCVGDKGDDVTVEVTILGSKWMYLRKMSLGKFVVSVFKEMGGCFWNKVLHNEETSG